jgi:7-carboxy-7-deazaguanine synthase
MTNELRVLSVFLTVDGEANVWGPGHWSVFVRFAGCTVGCTWCDTKYSWNAKGGEVYQPKALAEVVGLIGGQVRKVTITGGEPLEQDWPALLRFISALLRANYNVSVETAGTQDTIKFRQALTDNYPELVIGLGQLTFVVDYKLSSSGFKGTMDFAHFAALRRGDVVKFVVGSIDDYNEAASVAHHLDKSSQFLAAMYFSPLDGGQMTFSDLFYAMKKGGLDQIGVGYNLQMHKVIFPITFRDEEEGGIDFTKATLGREEYLRRMKKD